MQTIPATSRRFYDTLNKLMLWKLFVAFFSAWAKIMPPSRLIDLDGIDGGPPRPYLQRWHLIPRNRWFNAYLHIFVHGDDDRALHTHAWNSWSLMLIGRYYEVTEQEHNSETEDNYTLYRKMHPTDGRELISQTRDEVLGGTRLRYEQRFTEGDWRKLPMPHPHYLKLDGPNNDQPCMTLFFTGPRRSRWGFRCPEGFRDFEEYLAPHPTKPNATVGCD
jgi:hypothetical protein